jgi:uncharacterized protein (UPF0248 family)
VRSITTLHLSLDPMIPIQDLLHRIQWDAAFAEAEFEIAYYDRVSRTLVRLPLRYIRFPHGERFAFEAIEADGSVHSVPLHRVREVWRNGELIWQRPQPAKG